MAANNHFSGPAAHGDYLFGWEGDTLQKAMDNIGRCGLNTDCATAGIHAQTSDQYSACTKEQQAPEQVDGCKYPFNPSRKRKSAYTNDIQGWRLSPWARWLSRLRRFRLSGELARRRGSRRRFDIYLPYVYWSRQCSSMKVRRWDFLCTSEM